MNFKNKHKLKISIITVCLNSEKTIKTTLDSVANQSFKLIEHIIIDGKSTDKTISIVKKYSHITKIISEPDKGIYDAMNKGIKIANGDIICFLNSDDFYANDEVLSRATNIFNSSSSVDACYADLVYTDSLDIFKNIRYWKSKKFVPGLFSKGWCPPHTTFFARKSIYMQFGNFNLEYKIASDVELMMRFLEVYKINALYVPELWIKMRSGGVTNKNLKNIITQNKEILHALKSHKLFVNKLVFFVSKFFSRSIQFLRNSEL
ncbi:glycosyltransferase [Candidatus Pelagibacter sp.]|nr:glycosyltransferase [Candidatus Pelagibacter sp.]MDB4812006.1 glycosyltransferase [Candidatus Pelagibacter sp.]MDC0466000.1 glycosyltransferase [Candidatus Pelagibacter sp.]